MPEDTTMQDLGVSRFRRDVSSALAGRRRSTVGGGKALLRAAAKVVETELVSRLQRRGSGRRHQALPYLRKLKPTEVVYLALRTVIDQLASDPDQKLTRLVVLIGQRIEDEVRFRQFKKDDPRFFKRMVETLEGSQDYSYKRRMLAYAHGKSTDANPWAEWGKKVHLLIGAFLVDIIAEHTGLVSIEPRRLGRRKQVHFISLTDEAAEEMRRRDEAMELLRPWYLPTRYAPERWTKPWGGGYGEEVPPLQLVKTHNRWYFETLKHTPMPRVYRTINALQRTPWQINEDVLVVAEELWEAGIEVGTLPGRERIPAPPRPDFLPDPRSDQPKLTREEREALTPEQQQEFKVWKRKTAEFHDAGGRQRSKVVATSKVLMVADMFREDEAFYFPHQLDWRGRAYAVPLYLNPQGNDLARGLLRFAEARPLGETGGFWLAVHGANAWGEDKANLKARVEWVAEHEHQILEVAEDPLSNRWWTEADEPWQFLAFALEWARWVEHGFDPAFESSLVVSMDGSCNGLQHYSAMLRDPKGAEATNLVPVEEPRDVYTRVAERLTERLEREAGLVRLANGELKGTGLRLPGEKPRPERTFARQWLDSKLIDRSLVKRQVMTLPYGVTKHGMEDQLLDHCRKHSINLWQHFEDAFGARRFWVRELWGAIEDTVEAAIVGMDFLREVARQAAKEGLPLVWTAPSGFPVRQHYPATRRQEVRTLLLGKLTQFTLRPQDWSKLDRRRQVDGIAPNFVHSLDAAHLVLTVLATEKAALRPLAWAMVHDSYGTHAGDAELLARCLRQAFVDLYTEHPVLADFLTATRMAVRGELPAAPGVGELDLEQVLEADYFFA